MQDAGFQDFLQAPENRVLVETYQRKELLKAIKAKQKAAAIDFRDKASLFLAKLKLNLELVWR